MKLERPAQPIDASHRILSAGDEMNPLEAFEAVGFGQLKAGGLRVAVKPNLTWDEPRPGVTTSYTAVAAVVRALVAAGNRVSIVESDGGYGTFSADTAFEAHGLNELGRDAGASVVNLSAHPTSKLMAGGVLLDMPRMLLEDVDVIVNMPVPKVHVMARYTGAVKNQWGLIPTDMRLRLHSRITSILTDFLLKLPPQVVAMDGTFFLNESGPIEGQPVRRDIYIFAGHPVVSDAVALRLMGWDLSEIGYLSRIAAALGLEQSAMPDLPPRAADRYTLHRTFWNWVALAGFKSRSLTWLGYVSPLAGPLHTLKVASERVLGRSRPSPSHRRPRPGA